jgi:hypothetical protein
MAFGDPEGSVCGWKLGEMRRYNGKLPAANSESINGCFDGIYNGKLQCIFL